jgi:hypothetical protein
MTPILTVVLTTAVLSWPASAGPASEEPALTTDRAAAHVNRILASLGLDRSEIALQRSPRNYAGPNCPGGGWKCDDATRPVLQISSEDRRTAGRNVAECPPGPNQCVVFQITASGENLAECTQNTDQPEGAVIQSCEIVQVNSFGTNTALVDQGIRQQATGSVQDATQTATLTQENGSGSNLGRLRQRIDQSATATVLGVAGGGTVGALEQIQEAMQSTSVDQRTTSGNNTSTVEQFLVQSANAATDTSVGRGAVIQKQNALDDGRDLAARIEQHSSPTDGGTNLSELVQETRLDAEASARTVDQVQGSLEGGLQGFVNQFSSGLSTSVNSQDEMQVANADAEVVSQTQHGPMHCCTAQFDNPDNIFDILQTSSQAASDPDALQTNDVRGSCVTSGLCTVDQTVTQDGGVTTNACSGAACFPFILCPLPGGTPGDPCATGIRRVSWNRRPR